MAKNGSAKQNDEENELEDSADKPKLSPEERKAILQPLFKEYGHIQAEIEASEKHTAELELTRSEKVKEIFEKGGTGPYGYKGTVVTISKRADNFYFRGRGNTEIENIPG